MSQKRTRIAAMVKSVPGQDYDAHYLGYFDLFNRRLFYEAHDVLENLWLADKQGPNGDFYKGMIQLAGAFVHLQKNRLRPAAALFKLTLANLAKYPRRHEGLDLTLLAQVINQWLTALETGSFTVNPLLTVEPPRLMPAAVSPALPPDGGAGRDGEESRSP